MTRPDVPLFDAGGRALDARRVRLLRAAFLLFVACGAVMVALQPVLAPGQANLLLPVALVVPLALAATAALRLRRPALALRLFVYGTWVATTVAAIQDNGVLASNTVAYPVLIVFAGWLFGARSAAVVAGLSIAAEIGMAWARSTGRLPVHPPAPAGWYVLSHAVTALLVAALGALMAASYRNYLTQIRSLSRELADRVESLSRSESQLRLVTENVPAMIALYDEHRRCRFANRAYAVQFGWTTGTIVGRHGREVVGDSAYGEVEANVDEAFRGSRVRYQRQAPGPGGEPRVIDVALMPHRVEEGMVRGVLVMIQDVTEWERAKSEIRESEAKFLKIFRSSPVPISLSRLRDGLYLDINHAYLREFGWSREEVLGRTSTDLGLWPDEAARLRWAADVSAGRVVRDYETTLHDRHGHPHSVLISSETIEVGGEECAIALVFDITARKQAEDEVRRLNAELEERVRQRTADLTVANRELESFAYSISHDLRAPLRGIDGFSRLLQEDYGDRLDAQGHDYLARVRRAAQRLGVLIDHMLELSRLTRLEMRREPVDLARLAREVIDDRRKAEPGRRVEVKIEKACRTTGDPQMLRVLLENLLDNAWKYTRRNETAVIEFGCEDGCDPDGGCIYFVRDNGAGFDMAYADKLFSPFQRLHKVEEFDGSGIGLASASRVVRRHGGRIWAESAVDQGATFRFTLPT